MLPVLNHFMQHSSDEYLLCRCKAIESAGLLVEALGAADPDIAPHVPGMLEVVLQGFAATDSPDLVRFFVVCLGSSTAAGRGGRGVARRCRAAAAAT